MLIDAHNHLQDERFAGRQDELIREARAAGVSAMRVNGTRASDWPGVAALAERHPGYVIPNFGDHPWYIPERSPDADTRLREMLDRFPDAGVGEIGLDRWKPGLPWDGQEEAFLSQLAIATERNRLVTVHCLRAWGRLLELLSSSPRPACGFILHSYGGPAELVDPLTRLGAFFSFPGYFARPDKAAKREAFRRVPPDRLLVETDAPDQRPPDFLCTHPLTAPDGTPINHPANLAAIDRWARAEFAR